jgi:hypothetical protein
MVAVGICYKFKYNRSYGSADGYLIKESPSPGEGSGNKRRLS